MTNQSSLSFTIDNSFTNKLPADNSRLNRPRQVTESCFSYVLPQRVKNPKLIAYSVEAAKLIGLSEDQVLSEEFLEIFSGQKIYQGTDPYAMCYGGHQFGQWAGQLGDGRAINLMEVIHSDHRWQLQLKGSGKTPYSRTADGYAVLRSSIREYLCSEAMYHLGVPTTRALSLMLSGEQVMRDMLYDGNAAYEKGAIVCRMSPTFIRFGNFQIFAARGDEKNLRALTDYTIRYFFPHLGPPNKDTYLAFFQEIVDRTLDMILHWQRVGFVHGVMNTDNMSILGLTIDYGPYGWMDNYDPDWTPNTTDAQGKRYRYAHQPYIAQWNLAQLANALFPLIEDEESLIAILNKFKTDYDTKYQVMMMNKLGLADKMEKNSDILERLQHLLPRTEVDMTIFFRLLTNYTKENIDLKGEKNVFDPILSAFYRPEDLDGQIGQMWRQWILDYHELVKVQSLSNQERQQIMNATNPKYVLRNYMAQMAIDKADQGDYELISELHTMLKKPYDEQPAYDKWFAKRPEWARYKVGCSALSCSS